jgi:metal-dependent HD superfamily phosphatase/phosphodiesterase
MTPVDPPTPPREALADVHIRAPTRGNRRLEKLLEVVNADTQLKAWWHVSAVNATRRLGMSDHSWVHIHSISAYGIKDVQIVPGEDRPVRVEIAMSNSAGIFQVDELLAEKLRGSGLEDHIEVVARIEAETEPRLLEVFKI